MAEDKTTSIQVDASIPLKAASDMPAPVNPLTQYGDILKLQGAVNQNQLFPGIQKRQQQDIQLGDQAIAAGQLKQAADRGTAAYRTFGPLLAKGTAVTPDDVYGALGQASAIGLPVDAAIQEAHASMPVGGDPKTLGARMADWVKGRFGTTLSGPEQVGAFVGTPSEQQTGDMINAGTRRGVLAGGAPGGFVASTNTPLVTSPETRAAERPVSKEVLDENGRGTGVYRDVLEPRLARPGATGAPPVPPPVPGNGAYRPRGGAAAAPSATPASAYVSPPQGQPEALGEDVKGFKADQASIPSVQTGIVNLDTARQALAMTHSGRSTEAVHNFYSFLKAQGISPSFKDNDVTQYDIARKAMLSYASGAARGSGTDLGLESAIHSNASMDIDTAAAQHVINQNIGLQNQKIAQVREAPNGGTGVGYGAHRQSFTTDTDPRGFAWDRYTPEERQQIVDQARKTKGGYEKLVKSVEMATRHHLVAIPNDQPAAAPPAAAQPPDVPH